MSRKRHFSPARSPREQFVLGISGVLTTALLVRRDRVGTHEAEAFRALNELPDDRSGIVWALMQCGTLAAAPAAGAVSWLAGNRSLARRLLLSGTATWASAKVVKRLVGRPRPAVLLPGVRCRGSSASGLGYLSGHAGVAAALATAALPAVPRAARPLVLALIPIVGASRVYVGAHLPLDVLGGVGLGLAVEALTARGPSLIE